MDGVEVQQWEFQQITQVTMISKLCSKGEYNCVAANKLLWNVDN